MNFSLPGFIVGLLFGAALFLAGLANPDKIIGTLRLKDFHAMRVIAVFVLVSMLGVWILDLAGFEDHLEAKEAAVLSVLLGGALLGIGFGLTGYCPGTGLACAAAGRLDALIAALGMLVGALVFILVYPGIAAPLNQVANYGKVMLPGSSKLARTLLVVLLVGLGSYVLWKTRGGQARGPEETAQQADA